MHLLEEELSKIIVYFLILITAANKMKA